MSEQVEDEHLDLQIRLWISKRLASRFATQSFLSPGFAEKMFAEIFCGLVEKNLGGSTLMGTMLNTLTSSLNVLYNAELFSLLTVK